MFILDCVTGKPAFGVEEFYSTTQPFPVKPPPLARVSIAKADIVTADDATPEHAAACQELWVKHGFQASGPFTPWAYAETGAPAHEAIMFPGLTAGPTGEVPKSSKTGKELWSTKLAYTATAVPPTYQGKSGRKDVAIISAGSGRGPGRYGFQIALTRRSQQSQ